MDKPDKLSRLKSSIKSGNPELIDHAFEEIQNKGDETFVAPLIEMLHQPFGQEVKTKIYALFADLKHEKSGFMLMASVKQEQDPEVLEHLLSCCWQNGLNYSQELPFFVDLVLNQEFSIAFEAFTVVENMYGKIDLDTESKLLERIKRSLQEGDERKIHLLNGLLEIIPVIPLDQDPVDF
ncbi:MAG: hypothetical protein LWW85_06185 [Marinilabiliales bacterium]|nr:hypothetical protein [Marinilabiliales bacterium]